MKHITAIILCILIILSCASCGAAQPDTAAEPAAPAEQTPAAEQETVPEQKPEPAAEPEPEADSTAKPETAPEPEKDNETPSKEAFDLSRVQPIVENGRYVYNPYLLSQECIEALGEEFCRFYTAFITALMNHETECPCEMEDYVVYLDMVLSYECPFYVWGDLNFSWATDYDYDNNVFSWRYNVENDVIDKRMADISTVMQEYLDLVSAEDPEQDKMQTIYHAFCPKMTYVDDEAVSREQIEAYYALSENRGICVTFSYALAQILNQAGIYATLAAGDSAGEAHAWNYVRIDDAFYFFDPTYELTYNGGTAYVYYGMTLDERLASGALPEMMIGKYTDFAPETPETHLNVKG